MAFEGPTKGYMDICSFHVPTGRFLPQAHESYKPLEAIFYQPLHKRIKVLLKPSVIVSASLSPQTPCKPYRNPSGRLDSCAGHSSPWPCFFWPLVSGACASAGLRRVCRRQGDLIQLPKYTWALPYSGSLFIAAEDTLEGIMEKGIAIVVGFLRPQKLDVSRNSRSSNCCLVLASSNQQGPC